jgi:hypothetical protein
VTTEALAALKTEALVDRGPSPGPAVVAAAIDFPAVIVQLTASPRSKPSTFARTPSAGKQERVIAFVGAGWNS